jgi:4,5-dihydroxyphthalate decarboxylase
LAGLLVAGDLDAVFAPIPPRDHDSGNGPIARLVPDFRQVERQYFETTRCFPTQHVLLVKKETWDEAPEMGHRLLEIFAECETQFQAGQHRFPYGSPWQIAEVEEADRLMGPGFHAHGLENSRREVDVFCQAAFEDGLTGTRLSVEDYFAEFLRT